MARTANRSCARPSRTCSRAGAASTSCIIPEYKLDSATKDTRFVDGALLHELREPFGCWEVKDSKDNLDDEIAYKFKRGYPQDNIIFEDSTQAVLIQHREEVMRCDVADVKALENRCAIDWMLDQYKEKKPKNPTIREKFDTYRFADHKEAVIELLRRVTTVSVRTVQIVEAMRTVGR